jgi:polyisoprenoid-binding protein YceI
MTVTVSRSAGESAWAAQVELPVAGIRTGNGWRDASMRKMFDAERYPVITARFDRIEPVRVRPGDGRGSLPFVLEIGRVAKPIRAAVGTWKEAADQVAFEASFDVSLAEFGLEAPSVMGLAQVDDTVRVRVHAVVRVPPR